jgi:hypothetical protein
MIDTILDESKISVYDNVMSSHDAQFVNDIMSDKEFLWQYYHRSDKKHEIYHWHRPAGQSEQDVINNGFEWLIPMWNHLMYKIKFKEKYGIDTFRRIYFNAHTYGIEPRPHTDDGDFTMIYYPLLEWRKDWGGGTSIWTEHNQEKKEKPDKIEKHVAYTGNRLIVFPAKRLHQAMPVSKNVFKLRSCIVFKCFTTEANSDRLDYYKS